MKAGMLHRQARTICRHGTIAFAPNVSPYETADVRNEQWIEHIDRILDQTQSDKLSLIGFSAGGLDARRLVYDYPSYIASVITVSTPHRGSETAEWLLTKTTPVRLAGIAGMHLIGRIADPKAHPRVKAGIAELRPSHLKSVFNPTYPDHPDVFYGSYTACSGKGTPARISPALWAQNRILYKLAGVNDGMVPITSAVWGIKLGMIYSDHLRLCGAAPRSGRHSEEFFLRVVKELSNREL